MRVGVGVCLRGSKRDGECFFARVFACVFGHSAVRCVSESIYHIRSSRHECECLRLQMYLCVCLCVCACARACVCTQSYLLHIPFRCRICDRAHLSFCVAVHAQVAFFLEVFSSISGSSCECVRVRVHVYACMCICTRI